MKNDEIRTKMTEIVTKIGTIRINRNRMSVLSLSCILINFYAVDHIEFPTTDEKTFVASMTIIIVVSLLKAIKDQHEINILEEEYQNLQSETYQKKKTFPIGKL